MALAQKATPFRPTVNGKLLAHELAMLLAQGHFNTVPVLAGMVANEKNSFDGKEGLDQAAFDVELTRDFSKSRAGFEGFYPARTDAERLLMAWQMRQDSG